MRDTSDLLNDRRHPGAPVAPAGTKFVTFDHVQMVRREFTVAEACASKRIRWHCIVHDLSFAYQADMEVHADHRGVRGCQLVAICLEHQGRPEAVKPARRSAERQTLSAVTP